MGKILNAFVREELRLEPFTDFDSEETQKAREYAERLAEQFSEKLSSEQLQFFENLTNAQAEEAYLYDIERVIFGYRLGVLMTTEVFTDMNELFSTREVN